MPIRSDRPARLSPFADDESGRPRVDRSGGDRQRFRQSGASPIAAVAIACALAPILLAGCGGNGGNSSGNGVVPLAGDPPKITPRPADGGTGLLKSFLGPSACDQLETYLEDSVLASLAEPMLILRRHVAGQAATSSSVSAASATSATSAGSTASSASAARLASTGSPRLAATVSAVEEGSSPYGPRRRSAVKPGVDESDFVQDDGASFWTLGPYDGSTELLLARIDRRVDGSLVDGARRPWGTALTPLASEQAWGLHLLDGDRLATITTGKRRSDVFNATANSVVADTNAGHDGGNPAPRLAAEPAQPAQTAQGRIARVSLIDTASATLDVAWQGDIDGVLLSSRRVGNSLHLVTRATLHLPATVVTADTLGVDLAADVPTAIAQIDRQITANEAAVRAVNLKAWLAPLGQASDPTPAECAGFSRVDAPTWPDFLRITTVDTTTGLTTHRTVLAGADAMHHARHAMILASPAWTTGASASTHLHRFALDDRNELQYDGSTRLDGRLLDPSAIDESDTGIVRVAAREVATSGQGWTYLASYEPAPAPLAWRLHGRSDPIAPTTPITTVDFLANQALLATDDATDPLLVYDLSRASQPTRLGVIELPGNPSWFSLIAPGWLLGVADAGIAPWQPQLEVTLFDVTDPALPRVHAKRLLDPGTTSPALADPRNATWAATAGGGIGLLAVVAHPMYLPPVLGSGPFGIDIVSVRPELGSEALARVGLLGTLGIDAQTGTHPLRTFFLGDHVYAITPLGARSAAIATPDEAISTISLRAF